MVQANKNEEKSESQKHKSKNAYTERKKENIIGLLNQKAGAFHPHQFFFYSLIFLLAENPHIRTCLANSHY